MPNTPVVALVVTHTVPVGGFKKITGLGHNKIYDLFHNGEVDTVVTEHGRRLVILSSWEAYLDRRRNGRERDPAERAAAIAAFGASLNNTGAANAARARRAAAMASEASSRRAKSSSSKPAPATAVSYTHLTLPTILLV